MVTFPNAKINIGLDILRKRPDGYHDISTVMMPIPWCDILEIVPSDGGADTLTVTGRRVDCPSEKNLVMKAVQAMHSHAGFPHVDVFLHKVIPDGAGLGGGSADAAFTLKMLNEMFGIGLTQDALAEVAATLGADCPFFIYNRPMLCEGTGTEMSDITVNLPAGMVIAVVKPAVSVPTRDAYAAVVPAEPVTGLRELLSALPVTGWMGKVKNDFERSVFMSKPEIRALKERMLSEGAVYASMSGSGSSVYGFFTGQDSDILTERVASVFSGCDIMVKSL